MANNIYTYNIILVSLNDKGKLQQIEGEKIIIKGFEQFAFAGRYDNPYQKQYTITDLKTGYWIARGWNKGGAVTSLIAKLKKAGVDKYLEVQKKGVKAYGVAND